MKERGQVISAPGPTTRRDGLALTVGSCIAWLADSSALLVAIISPLARLNDAFIHAGRTDERAECLSLTNARAQFHTLKLRCGCAREEGDRIHTNVQLRACRFRVETPPSLSYAKTGWRARLYRMHVKDVGSQVNLSIPRPRSCARGHRQHSPRKRPRAARGGRGG